jgi:hypothetical protein
MWETGIKRLMRGWESLGCSFYHPGATCVIGKAVDGDCRVVGMGRLRVLDTKYHLVTAWVHCYSVCFGGEGCGWHLDDVLYGCYDRFMCIILVLRLYSTCCSLSRHEMHYELQNFFQE